MDAIALEYRVVLQGQRWPFPAVVRQCSTTGRSRRRSHHRLNSSQLQYEKHPESSSGEVDPVHRDRLRIAHEEYLRQLHLEDAVPQWKVFGWFTVVADHANRHPVRTFRVQWRVFLAFLPQSHPLPVSELNTAASSVTLPFEARKFSRSFKCGRSRYASISRQAVYRASARQLPAYWTPFSRQHLIYVLF